MSDLTHLDASGQANMVNISGKGVTERTATAQARVRLSPETFARIHGGESPKGDLFAAVRLAGIQAAKKTSDLIPLCHPLLLTRIDLSVEPEPEQYSYRIEATCGLSGKTGVEMEALTAASVAALTFYDMCKAIDKGIVIDAVRLIRKTGGKSGDWHA